MNQIVSLSISINIKYCYQSKLVDFMDGNNDKKKINQVIKGSKLFER